jgi:hypothetical protein
MMPIIVHIAVAWSYLWRTLQNQAKKYNVLTDNKAWETQFITHKEIMPYQLVPYARSRKQAGKIIE